MGVTDAIFDTLSDLIQHPYGVIYGYISKEYSRNSIQRSLQRLEKKGYIQKGLMEDEICIKLTELGIKEFHKRQQKDIENKLHNLKLPKKKWDKIWRVVVFDIPEENKRIRHVLRQTLRILEFKPIQKSVWISKNNYTKQLRVWVKDLGLSRSILIFETRDLF